MHKSYKLCQIVLQNLSGIEIIDGKKSIRNISISVAMEKCGIILLLSNKKPLRFSKPSLITEVQEERTVEYNETLSKS